MQIVARFKTLLVRGLTLGLLAFSTNTPAAESSAAESSAEGSVAETPIPDRTAVTIVLSGESAPSLEAMQSWFVVDGQPQRVLAVEKGPAEVTMIRDLAAQSYLDILARAFLNRELRIREWRRAEEENRQPKPLDASNKPQHTWDPQVLQADEATFVETGRPVFRTAAGNETDAELVSLRNALQAAFPLAEETRLRFVEAQAAPVSRTSQPMSVFNLSPSLATDTQGFLTFVERVPTLQFELRFADAVVVSARDLYAQAQRRAIVILIDGKSVDQSLHATGAVREFARRLQIPVFIWSFGPGAFVRAWDGRLISQRVGNIDTVLALANFEDVWEDLNTTLESQRIVWIEGHHPPPQIELSNDANGIRLAGQANPQGTQP